MQYCFTLGKNKRRVGIGYFLAADPPLHTEKLPFPGSETENGKTGSTVALLRSCRFQKAKLLKGLVKQFGGDSKIVSPMQCFPICELYILPPFQTLYQVFLRQLVQPNDLSQAKNQIGFELPGQRSFGPPKQRNGLRRHLLPQKRPNVKVVNFYPSKLPQNTRNRAPAT